MNAWKIFIALLVLIISIGAVCAADSSDNSLQASSNETGSFNDLIDDINDAGDMLEISKNYEFNGELDYTTGILLEKDNLIINGNNHIINGNSQTRIFNVTGENITINNLILMNGNVKSGGTIFNKGTITLNNITFINNNGTYGACIFNKKDVTVKNSKFLNNNAEEGTAISSEKGLLDIENSYFESKYSQNIGAIYAENTNVTINNCIFANTTSNYAPAVYTRHGRIIINNTKFINLKATVSAGALAVKLFTEVIVENCEFINTSSVKNGGAVFIDTAEDEGEDSQVIIKNTSFTNTSGNFGGAYVQLQGKVNMTGLIFTNCSSEFDGGAVYISNATATICNSTFIENKATLHDDYETYGGAIYFDFGELTLTDSTFIKNSAYHGNGICIYDSLYNIGNSTFIDNKQAIYSIFDYEESNITNIHGSDKISRDNEIFYSFIEGKGRTLKLINNEINLDTLPIRFDLRDFNWVSPVVDQGPMGDCWAIGVTGALESALLKSTGLNLTLSSTNMRNLMLIYSRIGDENIEGGFTSYSVGYLLSWLGAIPEEYDSHDELGKLSPTITSKDNIHVQDIIIIPRNIEIPGNPEIKQGILKYGSLAGCFDADDTSENGTQIYYNENTSAQYNPNLNESNHVISIIGWDDTFPKEKFAITPPGDGAWIIKNSWGTDFGEKGYMYLSYYDKTLCAQSNYIEDCAIGIIFENAMPYNKNYQYDFGALYDFETYDTNESGYGTPMMYENYFQAIDDDLLAAVGTYFNQAGVKYTVEIELNGKTVYTQKGTSPYYGYHTIKLNKFIPIKNGDEFGICITSNAIPYSGAIRACFYYDTSYAYKNGEWFDTVDEWNDVACIKAYTVADNSKISSKKLTMDYNDGSYFKVTIRGWDGKIVGAGEKVTFKINGKTYTAKTNSKGVAKIKITEVPKTYTITTSYLGSTVKNAVVVKQVMKSTTSSTIKKSAKTFTLQATLKTSAGKAIKNKKIIFKFNGKTYTAKTNSKGIAKLIINKNAINKLKQGKTYTLKITYNKDTILKTIKVTK